MGGGVDGPARPADADAFRDVLPAEYSALRAEIVGRISAQDVLVNLHLTAVAAIVGFAVAEHGSLGLLLLITPLSCAVSAPKSPVASVWI